MKTITFLALGIALSSTAHAKYLSCQGELNEQGENVKVSLKENPVHPVTKNAHEINTDIKIASKATTATSLTDGYAESKIAGNVYNIEGGSTEAEGGFGFDIKVTVNGKGSVAELNVYSPDEEADVFTRSIPLNCELLDSPAK